ncbi:MAG TPA: glycoside hydrolase family 3 C-terminal domain-containing protein, partial [Chitinophagaceae bacterium]|nr:glycoside hydrolase family 3 C-terminal domain-containing protein [Chitinophagaceae bacterium]
AEGDDGYRVFMNGKSMVDAWLRNRWGAKQFILPVKKDSSYTLVVEHYQTEGPAMMRLHTGHFEKTDMVPLLIKCADADAIVFVGGISPQLEGEEMPVTIPGFKGGDRTSILLPAVQTELMKTLKISGKPVVFVMMTGSAIATPWESENIPAIVNCWYGGQSAGTAVADVLFGDYNPAGRLPVTFYKSDSDLPDFKEYDMTNRTYRYFQGEVLYPFGYGLSYTTFMYSGLKVPASLARNKKMTVSITVKNTGKKDGEEVVQLYVAHAYIKGRTPLRALKGFRRILLKAGESKLVTFTLAPEQLSLVSEENGQFYQPDDKITISIGGGQPGVKNKTTSNVISKSLIVR